MDPQDLPMCSNLLTVEDAAMRLMKANVVDVVDVVDVGGGTHVSVLRFPHPQHQDCVLIPPG